MDIPAWPLCCCGLQAIYWPRFWPPACSGPVTSNSLLDLPAYSLPTPSRQISAGRHSGIQWAEPMIISGLDISAGKVGIYFLLENFFAHHGDIAAGSAGLVSPLIKVEQVQWLIAVLPFLRCCLAGVSVCSKRSQQRQNGIRYPGYCMAIVLMCIYWGIAGLSFTCLHLTPFPGWSGCFRGTRHTAIYIFSWCLGYLAGVCTSGHRCIRVCLGAICWR